MANHAFLKCAALALTLLFTASSSGQVRLNNGAASGSWFNPERDGEGIFVEIVEAGDGEQIVVSWYTYDHLGLQMWLVGNAPLESGQLIVEIPMQRTSGPSFGNFYDPADLVRESWGTITLTFPTCDSAILTWNGEEPFGIGLIEMQRLTSLVQVLCPAPPWLGELTAGTWQGDGICFNVAEDGESLTSVGSSCADGVALSASVAGRDSRGDDCTAKLECSGEVDITAGLFACPTVAEGASGKFTSPVDAEGTISVTEGLLRSCTGTWTATASE